VRRGAHNPAIYGVPVACPIGRSTPGTHGHSRLLYMRVDLDMSRPLNTGRRPVTKLLASPVTVWNRHRCLQLAQRGQRPSDNPFGDHGGSVACSPQVSPIRAGPERGMKSSKQRVRLLAGRGGRIPSGCGRTQGFRRAGRRAPSLGKAGTRPCPQPPPARRFPASSWHLSAGPPAACRHLGITMAPLAGLRAARRTLFCTARFDRSLAACRDRAS
jgi:hypothetical protein